jgi:hypothetical protein
MCLSSSVDQALDALYLYPIVSVALLFVKYMRMVIVIGYGVLVTGTVSIWFLYVK